MRRDPSQFDTNVDLHACNQKISNVEQAKILKPLCVDPKKNLEERGNGDLHEQLTIVFKLGTTFC